MPNKYIFYDLETTGRGKKENPKSFGLTPKWEQILQVAAIVTDENFKLTNQTMNEFCRLRSSIIAQPGALLTTQKGIRDILNSKLSSYELMKKINSQFYNWDRDYQDSVFIGHNSLNFDESVLEYNLFNNLFYPYITRKRGDTLNLVRAGYALNPSKIKTNLTAKGNPSFRLEDLANLNNLPIEFAHDAFSDVKTSIALARFVKDMDPNNWSQYEAMMNKELAIKYINNNKGFSYMTSFLVKSN